MPNHEVACVGHQAHALPHYEHGVGAEDGVGADGERPYEGDDPEAGGEHAASQSHGIEPLIDEAQGEDNLSGRAVKQ